MIMIGVILLLLNALFVVIDVKNNRIRKRTLLNAFAAGCVFTTLVHVL
jgi:hypothetical protein